MAGPYHLGLSGSIPHVPRHRHHPRHIPARPSVPAYAFACELAEQETAAGYMTGEGGSWGWIERRQVSALLADFAARRALPPPERAHVEAWVASLPWNGADALELHFGW